MKKSINRFQAIVSIFAVCAALIVGAITAPLGSSKATGSLPAPFTKMEITPVNHSTSNPVTKGGQSWAVDSEVNYDAGQTGQYSIAVPDYMTSDPATVSFVAKSDVATLTNYEHVGSAATYDGNTCMSWNGGYWKFNFSVNNNSQVGGGTISLRGTLPGYITGFSAKGNISVGTPEGSTYDEEFYVNVQSLVNSDTWGYGIKNNLITSTGSYADEYSQGYKRAMHLTDPVTGIDENFAYGFLNKDTPDQNMEYVAFTGPMMGTNGPTTGTKNVKTDIAVSDGLDVKNTNPSDTNRTSQHGIAVQSVDVKDSGGGHFIETPGTYKYITSQFKEVAGNYGDPLNYGEIRVSVAPTGVQHIEARLGDIAKDKKLYLQYHTDVVSLPANNNGNPEDKYPNYLSVASASSDDFADFYTGKIIWQTLAHGTPTAYGADLKVDKTKASKGEKINYTLHFKSNKDKLDADIKISTDNSNYILNNLKATDPDVKLTYDAENKMIHATSDDFGGKEFDITYTVDSKDMNVGYITKNSFTISSVIDGKTYLGNEVATEITDKEVAGNITLHFVDADDNSLKLRDDVVLTPQEMNYIGDSVDGKLLDHAEYDQNIDSSYAFSRIQNDVDLSKVIWSKDVQDITFLYEGGHLIFKSAPKNLEFGSHDLFADNEKTFNLESKDDDLVVQDGRTISKKPTWSLSGQLVKEFTGESTNSSLSNVLFFNDGVTNQAMSLNSPVNIVSSHTTIDKNDVNVSSDWTGNKGLNLKIQPGQAKADKYDATIQWTLSDGVANK